MEALALPKTAAPPVEEGGKIVGVGFARAESPFGFEIHRSEEPCLYCRIPPTLMRDVHGLRPSYLLVQTLVKRKSLDVMTIEWSLSDCRALAC